MKTLHEYQLTRSKRKTIGLYIRNGCVEVRAPLKMPKCDIDKFVMSKEKWINDRLACSKEQAARRDDFALDYGHFVIYRGKEYPIVAKDGNRIGFDDVRFYMPPGLSPEQIKSYCVQIYRLLAKRDLTDKVIYYAEQMYVMPSAIKINGAKTRWGSCSAKKSLNFSWRLIMACDEVIDYVVIHELAHITEMNHSARFWAVVGNVAPDYRERRKLLKVLQKRLAGENWENRLNDSQ